MDILPNMQIIDLALYTHNTLIISDIHLGYEEALNKQGYLIPRFQFREAMKRLEAIFENLKSQVFHQCITGGVKGNLRLKDNRPEPEGRECRQSVTGGGRLSFYGKKLKRVIINGDLKHEFGSISDQEWRHTLQLLDFLGKHAEEVILVKGTHDTILGPIARKRNVTLVGSYTLDSMFFIHGDIMPKKFPDGIKTIIIGHEHPAVSLKDGPRTEKFKCFLKGKYKKYNLIVLPSFNMVTEGTDILKERLLSPFLHQNLDNFNVYVVSDKVYNFGKVKDLR